MGQLQYKVKIFDRGRTHNWCVYQYMVSDSQSLMTGPHRGTYLENYDGTGGWLMVTQGLARKIEKARRKAAQAIGNQYAYHARMIMNKPATRPEPVEDINIIL